MINQKSFLSTTKGVLCFLLIAIVVCYRTDVFADKDFTKILVPIGQSELIDFKQPVKRVSITNPEIADATVTSPLQLLINGKTIGTTTMIVWSESEEYDLFRVIVHSEASSHQVMLLVRFVEINLIALKELGIDFLIKNLKINSTKGNIGSFGGKVGYPNDPLLLTDVVDFFLSSPTEDFSAIIKALEEKNFLTILAKPNLCAINGTEASFHAGGEFPIPIVSGSAGMQTVTIQFKEFGVKLNFIPTVLDSELVNIQVAAEVSNLDFENGVTLSGFRIPSLVMRKTKTVVELKQNQYLIISGLLSKEMAETVSKIPGLGHIPILGKLFSSTRYQNKESDLYIIVSPRIIQSMEEDTLNEVDKLENHFYEE